MSSQTDMEALSAKVRRLEVLFEIQQRESAAEPNNRAIQPAVTTGFSDPALQAENSRLRKEIAAKDAIIAKRDRTISGLLESMGCHEGVLAEMVRDMNRSRETAAAQNDDRPQREMMPEISVLNTDKSCNSVPTLPPKDVIGDDQTGSQIAPFGLSTAKVPADKLQIGQEVPVYKNKKYPNGMSPELASYVAKTDGIVYDNTGNA